MFLTINTLANHLCADKAFELKNHTQLSGYKRVGQYSLHFSVILVSATRQMPSDGLKGPAMGRFGIFRELPEAFVTRYA